MWSTFFTEGDAMSKFFPEWCRQFRTFHLWATDKEFTDSGSRKSEEM
jgi:hypothetical protein